MYQSPPRGCLGALPSPQIMALYIAEITVPAGTTEDNPVTQRVTIKKDIITKISVRIPPGHFAKTGIAFYYGIKQIAPKPEGTWIKGDAETVEFELFYEMPEVPGDITIKAYNTAEDYSHTFYVRIEALDKWVAMPWMLIKKFVDAFKVLIGLD